jgi:hypothetical protein
LQYGCSTGRGVDPAFESGLGKNDKRHLFNHVVLLQSTHYTAAYIVQGELWG